MKSKLKLTKLTVSNLDRVKGGVEFPECGCHYTNPKQGAFNYNINHTITCICPINTADCY